MYRLLLKGTDANILDNASVKNYLVLCKGCVKGTDAYILDKSSVKTLLVLQKEQTLTFRPSIQVPP